jgi:hypothetical protein
MMHKRQFPPQEQCTPVISSYSRKEIKRNKRKSGNVGGTTHLSGKQTHL